MIPLFKVHMPPEAVDATGKTLLSGFIGEGPRVKEFEAALSGYIGNPRCLSLNSCTSAIQLALRLAGVGPGDEVISTPMTCTATNEPILAAGARIVWADIDPTTGNIDPGSVEDRVTGRTKAVIAVHWGGEPARIGEINCIARTCGLKVIEDAAHALGAESCGQKIGTLSDYVCFSFQAIKHITTGDGGALFCRSDDDYRRGKPLRWYGIDREQPRTDFRCETDISEWGYKFHMNDLAATLGLVQMPYLAGIVQQRRELAEFYDRELWGVLGVKPIKRAANASSAHWLYTLLVERRADFMRAMTGRGVTVSQVHARNDTHTMFREFHRTELPGVNEFARSSVCIPIGYWVGEEERRRVVEAIRAGW